MDSLPD